MKQVYKMDANGFYLGPILLNDNEEIPTNHTATRPPDGLYKAQFVNEGWVEGMSQTEIDAIKNQPVPKTEIELIKEQNAELNLQIIDLYETLITGGVI